MDIDCPASFTVVDGKGWGRDRQELERWRCTDVDRSPIAADATLQIEIKPVNDITPRWLRSGIALHPVGDDGSFAVACQISRILG